MTLIDVETGEIIEDVNYIVTNKKDQFFKANYKMSEDKKEFIDEYGNFIFKTDTKQAMKLDNKISGSDIAKLIYCATYLDYDNVLHYDNGKPITKSDLKNLIGVDNKIFYPWYNLMVDNKIIIEKDKKLTMSKKYYIKGKLTKSKKYNRIFIDAIRYVYEENRGKNLKTLGLIIRMLPNVNYSNNILCWNPNCGEDEEIKPVTVKELMELYGINNERNTRSFINQISKLRVYDGQPLVLFFNDDAYMTESYIMFNPRLTHSGTLDTISDNYKLFVILANKQKTKISKNKAKNRLNTSDTKRLR